MFGKINFRCLKLLVISCLILGVAHPSEAQEYLQLEFNKSLTKIRYRPGQKLVYKTKTYHEKWQKSTIDYFLYDEEMVVFDNGIAKLSDITEIRTFNGLAYAIAKAGYLFATRSLVFAAIDIAYRQRKINIQDVLFTVGPAGIGFFLDKLVSYKKYRIGKTTHLRLLDLRM